MNCHDIIKAYLLANNYDGLAGDECGCSIEDMTPCGECYRDCVPAYRWKCDECTDKVCNFVFVPGGGCYRNEKQGENGGK